MRKKIRSGMGKRFPRTCVSKMRRRTKSSMEFADDAKVVRPRIEDGRE
jgi:hypothetical protein